MKNLPRLATFAFGGLLGCATVRPLENSFPEERQITIQQAIDACVEQRKIGKSQDEAYELCVVSMAKIEIFIDAYRIKAMEIGRIAFYGMQQMENINDFSPALCSGVQMRVSEVLTRGIAALRALEKENLAKVPQLGMLQEWHEVMDLRTKLEAMGAELETPKCTEKKLAKFNCKVCT